MQQFLVDRIFRPAVPYPQNKVRNVRQRSTQEAKRISRFLSVLHDRFLKVFQELRLGIAWKLW